MAPSLPRISQAPAHFATASGHREALRSVDPPPSRTMTWRPTRSSGRLAGRPGGPSRLARQPSSTPPPAPGCASVVDAGRLTTSPGSARPAARCGDARPRPRGSPGPLGRPGEESTRTPQYRRFRPICLQIFRMPSMLCLLVQGESHRLSYCSLAVWWSIAAAGRGETPPGRPGRFGTRFRRVRWYQGVLSYGRRVAGRARVPRKHRPQDRPPGRQGHGPRAEEAVRAEAAGHVK